MSAIIDAVHGNIDRWPGNGEIISTRQLETAKHLYELVNETEEKITYADDIETCHSDSEFHLFLGVLVKRRFGKFIKRVQENLSVDETSFDFSKKN